MSTSACNSYSKYLRWTVDMIFPGGGFPFLDVIVKSEITERFAKIRIMK